jgi:hypothetical protein
MQAYVRTLCRWGGTFYCHYEMQTVLPSLAPVDCLACAYLYLEVVNAEKNGQRVRNR